MMTEGKENIEDLALLAQLQIQVGELQQEKLKLLKIIFPCEICHGIGKLDDAEPGDISFREWECPHCGGFSVLKATEEVRNALVEELTESVNNG